MTLVLILSIVAALLVVSQAVYQILQLKPYGYPHTNTQAIDTWLALQVAWVATVLLRRSISLSHTHASTGRWWEHLLHPKGQAARAALSFAGVFFIVAVLTSLAAFSNEIGVLQPEIEEMIEGYVPSAGVLLSLFFISLVYFNHTPEQTSFMAKLVGVALVTIFLILGFAGMMVAPAFADGFRIEALQSAPRTFRFTPHAAGGYNVTALPDSYDADLGQSVKSSVFSLPFSFPFYENRWKKIEIASAGYLVFGEGSSKATFYNLRPAIFSLRPDRLGKGSIFVKETPARITITWARTHETSDTPTQTQLTLYSDGAFEMTYHQLGVAFIRRIGIQAGNGGSDFSPFDLGAEYRSLHVSGDGMLTDYDLRFRQYMHAKMAPLATLVLVASLLILVGFHLFFYPTLVKPLYGLVAGVRAVDEGNLQVQVPVQYQDEIGLVSKTFNRMVASVYEAGQFLEARIAERTQELRQEMQERERAERRVSAQHQFLQTVLDSLSHPFYVINVEDYTVEMANVAAHTGSLPEDAKCYALTYEGEQQFPFWDYLLPIYTQHQPRNDCSMRVSDQRFRRRSTNQHFDTPNPSREAKSYPRNKK